MLEHVSVKSAFGFAAAGPTSRAIVFIQSNGDRAWRASDASIAAFIKRVHWQLMIRHISLNVALRPIEKRINLQQSVILQFQNLRVSSVGSLIASNAADPGFQPAQRFLHRLDFINVTTQVRVLERERTHILACKMIPTRIAIKINDVEIPFVLDSFAENQRVPKMVACIEEENFDVRQDARGHMQKRHALRLERRAQRDLGRELVHRPLDDFLRCLCFELQRKRGDFFLRFHG